MLKIINHNYLINKVKFFIRYFFLSFLNTIKIKMNNDTDKYYLPNFLIKNIVTIDPRKIKYRNSIPLKYKKESTPFIYNFDWDEKNELLSNFEKEDPTYNTCRELFIENLEIKKCQEFYFFKEQIRKFGIIKNCKNEDDIILYFKELLKVFENIKKNGLKKITEHNIELMVDRNNNLVKINKGNHRFFISRILKLKSIPAEIKVIHSNCIENRMNNNDLNNFIRRIELNYK